MSKNSNSFYVYVYIDPRNFEEFYYGKGKGSRKLAHLNEEGDSEKVKRIAAIKKAGLEPIIKVIARNLSESEAYLVEKTLIWRLGRTLTNLSSGHFSEKFRPHDTLHLNLSGFDFQNGIYYVNVGEGQHRDWEDCKRFGFLSAGQHPKWSDQIRTLEVGDIVIPYLKGRGYVGIGRVTEKAVPVLDFRINKKSLNSYDLQVPNIFENSENENTEYLVRVNWLVSLDSSEAKWKPKSGLFTTQLVKASLDGQPQTIEFLTSEFSINLWQVLISDS